MFSKKKIQTKIKKLNFTSDIFEETSGSNRFLSEFFFFIHTMTI